MCQKVSCQFGVGVFLYKKIGRSIAKLEKIERKTHWLLLS